MDDLYNSRACRGERSGAIICHNCGDNECGFCKKHKKWCSSVRSACEVALKMVSKDTNVAVVMSGVIQLD